MRFDFIISILPCSIISIYSQCMHRYRNEGTYHHTIIIVSEMPGYTQNNMNIMRNKVNRSKIKSNY